MSTHLGGIWSTFWIKNETVPISECVHYCGFQYGRNQFNPYENYVISVARGEIQLIARSRFEDFLQHYRPKSLGESLGISLSRFYPLWAFPWDASDGSPRLSGIDRGWMDSPADVPDIITHFSALGILRDRIEEEYGWLENAYYSIRDCGYQPGRFAGHIQVRKLVSSEHKCRYLVLDGNHRLSALVATGHTEVVVRYNTRQTVHGDERSRWPQVVDETFSLEDSEKIFDAYFAGNLRARTTVDAAPILSDRTALCGQ